MSEHVLSDPAASAKRQPHILFVSRKWPPAMGGMETYSYKLSHRLEAFGPVERVVLPGKSDGSTPALASVFAFGLSACRLIVFRRKAADIVHVADMASWPIAAIAKLRSRHTRVVLAAHGTDVAYPDQSGMLPRLYGYYCKIGARLIGRSAVIANSRATREKVRGLGYNCAAVVPLASEIARPKGASPGSGPAQGRRLLFAGRLVERKGCRWFVENVLPLLPEDVELDVAGTLWDRSEAEALKSRRVQHLGILEPGQLAQAYADAACVVVPNLASSSKCFEGLGLVAIEAAVAGGVVLASDQSGLKDAVIDGETGFKVAPEDAAAWAAAITRVLDWPAETRAIHVERFSETARAHFSWDRVARDTFHAYGWVARE